MRYDQAKQQNRDNHVEGGMLVDDTVADATTLNFGATYDFSKNVTGYVRYAESFTPVTAITTSGEILDPETGQSYELGVKTEWFDRRLGASLAVFRQDRDNVPMPDPTNPDFSVSGGLQRTKGIEIELAGSPVDGLTLGAAAAWFDSEHIDPADESFGLTPYGAFQNLAGLFASYELQGGPLRGFGFGATLAIVGKLSLSFGGSGSLYGTGTDALFVDGYERLDLNFYYKGIPKWNFALQVRKATDEVYIERSRDASGSNYFGSPRAALFRAEYKFF
jgi:iron complex outermembrane receptor protein